MPATVHCEHQRSRRRKKGVEGESYERIWHISGSNDDAAVATAFEAVHGAEFNGVPFRSYELEPISGMAWRATAFYEQKRTTASYRMKSGGGREKIFFGKAENVGFSEDADTDPPTDYGFAINVGKNGPAGVDIVVPNVLFEISYSVDPMNMNDDYLDKLENWTGKTNSEDFTFVIDGITRLYPPESILFLGGSAKRQANEDWEVILEFAYSQNRDDLVIGAIDPIDKPGHHYLWVYYEDVETNGVLVPTSKYVYVIKVYDTEDLNGLLIP